MDSDFVYPEWYVKLVQDMFAADDYNALRAEVDANVIDAGRQIARRYERTFTSGPSYETLEEMVTQAEGNPTEIGEVVLSLLDYRQHFKQLHDWWYEEGRELADRASRNCNLS